MLEGDETLVGANSRSDEVVRGKRVAGVGQGDGLRTTPDDVGSGVGWIRQDETVLCEALPIWAAVFSDENMLDTGYVDVDVAVQWLGVVAGAVVVVHIEPGVGSVGGG